MRFSTHGIELDYEVHGDASAAQTVIFLHGLAMDRHLLIAASECVFQRTEHSGWRRIYVDLPGHGLSSSSLELGSADAMVAVLYAFVQMVGNGTPAIVAHGYGAYLTMGLIAIGARLAGLLSVCPVVEPDLAARRIPLYRVAKSEPDLAFIDVEEEQIFGSESVVHTKKLLETFRRVVQPAHRAADRPFLEALRSHYVLSYPLRRAWSTFSRPINMLCGRDDHWNGYEDTLELIHLAPTAELTILRDCGPLLPIEEPSRYQRLFVDWLERLRPAIERIG